MSIFGSDFDSPTPTPEPTTPPPTTPPPTTPPPIDVNELTQGDGEENGYRYVDLGLPLGTMWATCNVGATTPEDPGLLFQFGRVDGYAYKDTNHQFRKIGQDKEVTGNEFIPKTATGATYDSGATLGLADDAAHVNMEGNWRMPLESDFTELLANTKHDVVTVNDVKGMLFTSRKNGKRLFIPFDGCWNGDSFYSIASNVNVWSSQVNSGNFNFAYSLNCYSSGNAYAKVSTIYRIYANSVRGVFKK